MWTLFGGNPRYHLPMITDQERNAAIVLLARSRQTLLDAIDGVSDIQSCWQSEPGRWTILEYVEHLAISDDALIALVERSLKTEPRHETPEARRVREQKIK